MLFPPIGNFSCGKGGKEIEWSKSPESKLKQYKPHGNTSFDNILRVLLPLHQAHNVIS